VRLWAIPYQGRQACPLVPTFPSLEEQRGCRDGCLVKRIRPCCSHWHKFGPHVCDTLYRYYIVVQLGRRWLSLNRQHNPKQKPPRYISLVTAMADKEIRIQPAQAHYISRRKLEKLLLRLFGRPIAVIVSIRAARCGLLAPA
jgi:hypothetical protein